MGRPVSAEAIRRLGSRSQNALVLTVLVVAGALAGWALPHSTFTGLLADLLFLYASLLQMLAVPFALVSVVFGLRQMYALPKPGLRMLGFVVAGMMAMILCAVLGVGISAIGSIGANLTEGDLGEFGLLVKQVESDTRMALFGPESVVTSGIHVPALLSDNVFNVIAFGTLPSMLVVAIVFGLAFALQPSERARVLANQLEAVYRTLERLIDGVNLMLPVAAFALGAFTADALGVKGVGVMAGFLCAFVVASCITVAICVWVVARQCGRPFADAWGALLEPIKVSLVSGVLIASVPALIEALSARLGLRRSVVEFSLPSVPLFFRAGEVVLLAVAAVFCFGLYGRSLELSDVLMICLLAPTGAFLAIGMLGPAMITAGAVALVYLDIPVQTVLPGVILLDVATVGLRNTVTAMVSCAVVACVSHGLELESIEPVSQKEAETLYFVLSRRQVMAGASLLLVAMVFTIFAGIGAGMQGASRVPGARSPLVSTGETAN